MNICPLPSVAFLSVLLFAASRAEGEIVLAEDFDGGGVNSSFTFASLGGAGGSVVSLPAPNGMAARVTNLNASNNNSIAFDAVPVQGARIVVELDFRMTDDAANAGAGGCCNEAADGFAFGLFETATYGAAGGLNPAGSGQNWEDPTVSPGFPGALVIGLDVFDEGGLGTIRAGGIGGPIDVLFLGAAPFRLNNNLFHRARLTVLDSGPNALITLILIEDVNGAATEHVIFSNRNVLNLDVDTLSARLIAGGRTGAAFVQTEIDNVSIDVVPKTDSDLNGLPDFWEELYELTDPDGHADGDLLTNLEEFERGTHPKDEDTDDDDLLDHVETQSGTFVSAEDTGTNPLDPDTDADGLIDSVETATMTYVSPVDTGTDPNVADSDNDQFGDGFEVTVGSDPNDAESFPMDPIDLGVGTVALVGGDLTDPENDGAPDANTNYNAVFAASEEAAFGTGEAAFNVFDNLVGGGTSKWCCGDGVTGFPTNPLWVSATFPEPYVLTSFTITSGDDSPERDPRVWEVQGSNDGASFTTIYRQDNAAASIFSQRLQVIKFAAGAHYPRPEAFTTFRFITFATGIGSGARFQLSELEFFGDPLDETPLRITEVTLDDDSLDIVWSSKPDTLYAIEWSVDGVIWGELDDSYPSGGSTTSYSYTGGDPDPLPDPEITPSIFLRVREQGG